MAVLAIAGAGALGSTALGLGWQAGWLIGSTVGSLLFGPDQPDIEGPRLRDLSVTSSAWGAPIPLIYGTMRASGNVIWAPGIREERQTRKVGGKGGGGQRQTTYGYYASFALGLAEGPPGISSGSGPMASSSMMRVVPIRMCRSPGWSFGFMREARTSCPIR